jgi:hypothetical protein
MSFFIASGNVISGTIGNGVIFPVNIASGAVTSGRIGAAGIPNGAQFLRDDYTWATAGDGDGNASVGAIKTVSGTYSLVSGDYTVLSNMSGASGFVTLAPAALSFSGTIAQGRIVNIKKIDPSANAVTVRAASGEAIDGATSGVAITSQYQSLQIQSDGTSYWIL